MNEIKYEIIRRIAVIKEESGGWATELNEVSWNEAEPKYDIRRWNADHTKMGKGITLGGIKMKKNTGRKALRDHQRKERKEAGRKKMKLHNALQQEHKLHLL